MSAALSSFPGPSPTLASDLMTRLARVDVCAVSDALDSLGASGVVDGLRPLWEGATLVGRAVTVKLAEWPPLPGAPPGHLGTQAIMAAGPGDVIVVDNGGRVGMGGWGGLLCAAAAHRGIAGVVVDGACRDVDEARAMRFPVFARGAVARTARGRVYEVGWGLPAEIGGVAVRTGDIVIGDGSGIVVLAAADAASVVATAEELIRREGLMRADLLAGSSVSEVLGRSYERMLG